MKGEKGELRLQGLGVSPGVAIGRLFHYQVYDEVKARFPARVLTRRQVPAEIARYRAALEQSRLDLAHLKQRLEIDHLADGVSILDAQLYMMDDPLITQGVEKEIRGSCQSADEVFCAVIQRCEERFRRLSDPVLQDRYCDIEDVARRVLRYLRSQERPTLADTPKDSIVFARELVASDTAEGLEGCVEAFVTEKGAVTSHAAILARAGNTPFVTHVDWSQIEGQPQGALVVIDGASGLVILSPSKATVAHYRRIRRHLSDRQHDLQAIGQLKAETYDGQPIKLSANLEIDSDLESLHQYGSCGVGLFRSEYLMLASDSFPSEAEQFICYRRIVRQMHGLPVVIRAFDVGGDKSLNAISPRRDLNPYLGWRAIRFLLREPQIFQTQLRAILRASAYGDVGIMFPLVSGLQELLEAKRLLHAAKEQLLAEGEAVGHIRVGCMIEVPSAAIISDLLARECDFLSIGTNDLVQYSLAVDRGNPALSGHYTPTHPAIVRLIRFIVSEANRCRIPVTVCGEVAADPRYTALLLGLGVHELSVSPNHIPLIKNAIRRISMVEAIRLADHVLSLSTADEIMEVLRENYRMLVPEDLAYPALH